MASILSLGRWLSLGILAVLMLRVAWISDDSLITLRTALNLSHGWGPGFNSTESVQAYTHPLWFLLWLALGAVSGEWLLTIVVLGLALSIIATALVLWSVRTAPALVFVTAALVLSNAFMEYTTSGLENPLAYLLIGTALVASLSLPKGESPIGARKHLQLGLLVAAIALTRLDLLLVLLPPTTLFVWRTRHHPRQLAASMLGFVVPLCLWFIWTYITYAALLPNTFDAKRNVLIPHAELIVQGIRYLWVTIEHDPITGLVLLIGLLTGLTMGSSMQKAWCSGVLLYLAYVVYIGGDFMAGRFLAVPCYVAILLAATFRRSNLAKSRLGDHAEAPREQVRASEAAILVITTAIILISVQRPPVALVNPKFQRWDYEAAAGVADERGFYVENTGDIIDLLMSLGEPNSVPPFRRVTDAPHYVAIADIRAAANEWPWKEETTISASVEVGLRCGLLGAGGIATGPMVHWIDKCALTDRFLAIQPFVASGFRWRVGHYRRRIPDGYVEAIANSDPRRVRDQARSEQLEALWDLIRRR